MDSPAKKLGDGENIQLSLSPHQIAAKKILEVLGGMTVTDGEITLDIVRAWLPQTSCVELVQVDTLVRRIGSHPLSK